MLKINLTRVSSFSLFIALLTGCSVFTNPLSDKFDVWQRKYPPRRDLCASATEYSVSSLLTNFDKISKGTELISLVGVPTTQGTITLIACKDGTSCCNQCSSGYVLKEKNMNISLLHRGFKCNNKCCKQICQPFGLQTKNKYRFVGRLKLMMDIDIYKYTSENDPGFFEIMAPYVFMVETVCRADSAAY